MALMGHHRRVRLQNSRFRKAGSAVSVILECEAREPHTHAGRILPRRFFTRSRPFVCTDIVRRSRSQKNTAVLQPKGEWNN